MLIVGYKEQLDRVLKNVKATDVNVFSLQRRAKNDGGYLTYYDMNPILPGKSSVDAIINHDVSLKKMLKIMKETVLNPDMDAPSNQFIVQLIVLVRMWSKYEKVNFFLLDDDAGDEYLAKYNDIISKYVMEMIKLFGIKSFVNFTRDASGKERKVAKKLMKKVFPNKENLDDLKKKKRKKVLANSDDGIDNYMTNNKVTMDTDGLTLMGRLETLVDIEMKYTKYINDIEMMVADRGIENVRFNLSDRKRAKLIDSIYMMVRGRSCDKLVKGGKNKKERIRYGFCASDKGRTLNRYYNEFVAAMGEMGVEMPKVKWKYGDIKAEYEGDKKKIKKSKKAAEKFLKFFVNKKNKIKKENDVYLMLLCWYLTCRAYGYDIKKKDCMRQMKLIVATMKSKIDDKAAFADAFAKAIVQARDEGDAEWATAKRRKMGKNYRKYRAKGEMKNAKYLNT